MSQLSKSPILLQLEALSKSIGGKLLFSDVSLSIHSSDRIAFMGANGSGKSSLFKILANEWEQDTGKIHLSSQWKISYLKQEVELPEFANLNELLANQSEVAEWDLKRIASGLGLSEDIFQKAYRELSGGYRMRFLLAYELAKEPDLILLDEPTNHLDLESVLFLENFLKNYKKSFLLISHDREFLKNTCNATMAIKNKKIEKLNLGIEEYFQSLSLRELVKEREQNRLEEKRQKLQSFVDRFRAKASKAKQAQSRLKQLEALPSIDNEALDFIPKIPIPTAMESGKRMLEAQSASIGYADRKILKKLELSIFRGEKIGIVGKNGAGKSTLLKHLAGILKDENGQIPKYYKNCEPAYFAQHLSDQLVASENLLDYLYRSCSTNIKEQEVLDLVGALGFSDREWAKPIAVLSGGEKMRVILARILLQKSPLLLLDEPTNHLDFQSVEALAKSLAATDSSIVLVSHDRSFVSQICNKIIEVDENEAKLFPGTYQDYVWRKQDLEEDVEEDYSEIINKSTEKAQNLGVKINYKEEKKRLKNELRELEKRILENETKQTELQNKLESWNSELLKIQGSEAAQLAKGISETQNLITLLEEEWLDLETQKDQITQDLTHLE